MLRWIRWALLLLIVVMIPFGCTFTEVVDIEGGYGMHLGYTAHCGGVRITGFHSLPVNISQYNKDIVVKTPDYYLGGEWHFTQSATGEIDGESVSFKSDRLKEAHNGWFMDIGTSIITSEKLRFQGLLADDSTIAGTFSGNYTGLAQAGFGYDSFGCSVEGTFKLVPVK